ncbi:MAG TPA: ankyrin repeat domain-containing protein, partial [Blastocatellia bacterium]|nr:ankyrin repeat domain-containing protein [Blastocatellia bacterium]
VVLLIQSGADVSAVHGGVTPLMRAARAGHLEICRLLIKAGADVNTLAGQVFGPGSSELSEGTALIMAAYEGHCDIVRLLLDAGAAEDIATPSGSGAPRTQTALYIAIRENRLDVAKVLIERGAAVNAAGHAGNTPLILATYRTDIELVKALIAKGADVTASNYKGESALHAAAEKGGTETARVLIEAGADANAKTKDGLTPLDTALERGHDGVAEVLRQAGARYVEGPEPRDGWMVREHWLDYPSATNFRGEFDKVMEEMGPGIVGRGRLPWGGWIVFESKTNADKVAAILKRAGCHEVTIRKMRLCYTAEDARKENVFERSSKAWICNIADEASENPPQEQKREVSPTAAKKRWWEFRK